MTALNIAVADESFQRTPVFPDPDRDALVVGHDGDGNRQLDAVAAFEANPLIETRRSHLRRPAEYGRRAPGSSSIQIEELCRVADDP
jgi:hypothetical protein